MFTDEEVRSAVQLRRCIHQNPELQFEEHATAALVCDELRALGYAVRTQVAGTGVIGEMHGNREGKAAGTKTIALRADMDALPISEQSDLTYRSRKSGVMHACGHDGHTASLLLAARKIAQLMPALPGTVRLLFQPAEENTQGALRMIAEGAIDGVDAIFGYHNRPGFRESEVAVRPGPTCGGGDRVLFTIRGGGGHASRPHLSVDPIYLSTLVIQAWQGIVSRALSPLASGVVSVTSLHAGSPQSSGVIPSSCEIGVNVRYDCPETRSILVGHLQTLGAGICDAWGATHEFKTLSSTPAVINDPAMAHFVYETVSSAVPAVSTRLLTDLPTLGGEDFAFYLEKVPGCLFFVGAGESQPDLHTDRYDFRDSILPVAAQSFVEITKAFLQHQGLPVNQAR